MYTALTIAGSDSSGGAGIQADLKTLLAHHVYGMSAVTALTAQNTTGVRSILTVTPEFLGDQLDAVFTDIAPDAVKVGMVPEASLIDVIAERLARYGAKNVVVDPVMIATSGARLIDAEAAGALAEKLFPLAAVITPNIPEAEALTGMAIRSREDMEAAARRLADTYETAVLLKGGHRLSDADDVLADGRDLRWYRGRRIDNPNTHGTGCTLSSAIAAGLAKGHSLGDAVEEAKAYVSGALAAMLDLGQGCGPLDHGFALGHTSEWFRD
jgi:hydroxymethylpyrimidine/phosphomethylpyrimidine kinase